MASYATVALRETPDTAFRQLSADDAPIHATPHPGGLGGIASKLSALSLPAKAVLALAGLGVILGAALGATLGKRPTPPPAASVCSWSDYRLPQNVRPMNYSIEWTPPLTPTGMAFAPGMPFNGSSTVDVLVLSPSPCILIHSAGLAVASATVQSLDIPGAPALPAAWTEDTANERLVVRVPAGAGAAPGARLRLSFTFSALLSTTNTGLYESNYKNDSGATVTMLATQFEATSARHAYVSFDEPGFKANFSLTLDGAPPAYTALGNMPIASTSLRSDGVSLRITFAPTPPMSTYLLVMVCGPLVSVTAMAPPTAERAAPLPVTGWAVARGNNAAALVYAVNAAVDNIPYYEQLFGVPFPLPKMDMAAIPDFAAGAMENWGLVTYRETALLGQVGVSSASELQRIAVVVAHELAHQWMGDIVTPAWWDALWLNEGFAARMEYLGTDHYAPSFGILQQFQFGTIIRALRADAFSDVQQLTQTVTSSALIEGQFSSISYQKGASVINMLQAYLRDLEGAAGITPPVPTNSFFLGITTYLSAFEPCSLFTTQSPLQASPPLFLPSCPFHHTHTHTRPCRKVRLFKC